MQRPGEGERFPTTPSKKSKDGLKGEPFVVDHNSCLMRILNVDRIFVFPHSYVVMKKGIISTLAFSYSPEYYAAGSLTPASRASDNIALFTESALEPVLSIGGVAEWEKGGVTQVGDVFNAAFDRLVLKPRPVRHPLQPYVPLSVQKHLVSRVAVDVQSCTPSYPVRRFQAE